MQENNMVARTLLSPERLEGEIFEAYKVRRKAGNEYVKNTRTKMAWDSFSKGTYRGNQK